MKKKIKTPVLIKQVASEKIGKEEKKIKIKANHSYYCCCPHMVCVHDLRKNEM